MQAAAQQCLLPVVLVAVERVGCQMQELLERPIQAAAVVEALMAKQAAQAVPA